MTSQFGATLPVFSLCKIFTSRLNSLEQNSGVELIKDCSTAPLVEKEAVELAVHIGEQR